MTIDTAFEQLVAPWDQQVCCEMPTSAGGTCRRPAFWRVDLHGCEQALMCTQHKNAYVRRARFDFKQVEAARCDCCGKRFTCFQCLLNVVPL